METLSEKQWNMYRKVFALGMRVAQSKLDKSGSKLLFSQAEIDDEFIGAANLIMNQGALELEEELEGMREELSQYEHTEARTERRLEESFK